MLSEKLEKAIQLATEIARNKFMNNIVSVDHLVYAILTVDDETRDFLKGLGVMVDSTMKYIEENIRSEYPVVDVSVIDVPRPSVSFKRVLERAVFVSQYSNRSEVYCLDVIDALFPERDSYITELIIEGLNISREEVRRYCSKLHRPAKNDKVPAGDASAEESFLQEVDPKKSTQKDPAEVPEELSSFLSNLNSEVRLGHIDPLIGRAGELNRIYEVLGRRKKNNVIMVGEPGVGKTAIAEGIAWNIMHHQVPEFLSNATVYSLDLVSAIAGTQFRGDYEKRLKDVFQFVGSQKNAILFIDEIQQLMKSNDNTETTTGATLVKGDLLRGNLHCVATTTYRDYNKLFAKDPAFARRFFKLDISQPSCEETLEILKQSKESYEVFHNVEYSEEVLLKIIRLSEKYMHNRFLPDKAFDVVDEIGSFYRINRKEKDPVRKITIEDVGDAFTRILKMPVNLNETDADIYRNLRAHLKEKVFGQDEAVNAVVDAVTMNQSGLEDATRPVGSFLFAGPTGVGKTEIVLQLAKELKMNLIRLDMSEYSSEFTVSKLLGSPPGYVGYNEGGLLTGKVQDNPRSVVLFDELEKAHPSIYNVLLQLMDNGLVTDGAGTAVSFRNTIVVMTTNCGASDMEKNSIGFTASTDNFDSSAAIKRAFSPEFRNRLDAIVWFKNLSEDIVAQVFDKLWNELLIKLREKQVDATVTENARAELIRRGYDRVMGARPMRRTIRGVVGQRLSREIMFGELMFGGKVNIDFKDGEFTFAFEPVADPAINQSGKNQSKDLVMQSSEELDFKCDPQKESAGELVSENSGN